MPVSTDAPVMRRLSRGSPVASASASSAAWPTVWKQCESASCAPASAGARLSMQTTACPPAAARPRAWHESLPPDTSAASRIEAKRGRLASHARSKLASRSAVGLSGAAPGGAWPSADGDGANPNQRASASSPQQQDTSQKAAATAPTRARGQTAQWAMEGRERVGGRGGGHTTSPPPGAAPDGPARAAWGVQTVARTMHNKQKHDRIRARP